jgi:hypothetical protein
MSRPTVEHQKDISTSSVKYQPRPDKISTIVMTSPVELETKGATLEELADELGPPRGYPQVATFMGTHPELAMVRRFRGLNARNLLYLQAELVQVEIELLECEKKDAQDKVDKRKNNYSKNFAWLLKHKQGNRQYELIERMRGKLKEYSKLSLLSSSKTYAKT